MNRFQWYMFWVVIPLLLWTALVFGGEPYLPYMLAALIGFPVVGMGLSNKFDKWMRENPNRK